MSRTLVIGNGFDLYQGYKTSYKDFLSFTNNLSLIKNDEIRDICSANSFFKYFWDNFFILVLTPFSIQI